MNPNKLNRLDYDDDGTIYDSSDGSPISADESKKLLELAKMGQAVKTFVSITDPNRISIVLCGNGEIGAFWSIYYDDTHFLATGKTFVEAIKNLQKKLCTKDSWYG